MPDVSAHDWFREKLTALLAEAERAGYARDVAEAVITDLMNGALAAPAPPPDEDWARDAGAPETAAREMPRHDSVPADGAVEGTELEQDAIPYRPIY